MKRIISKKILDKAIWLSEPSTFIEPSDFKVPTRKIQLNKSSTDSLKKGTSGIMTSKKCNKNIYYESQLELNFFIMLEATNNVVDYGCQPIKIEYKHDATFYEYHPDFYYLLSSGECVIGEIKNIYEMGHYFNWIKWKAMKNYCKKNGIGLLITNGHVSITDLNKKKINPFLKRDILNEFSKFHSIEWEVIYEIVERHNVSLVELTYLVIQEKIKWYRKPARFVKNEKIPHH